jgi:ketosteroid isomerase-like protein
MHQNEQIVRSALEALQKGDWRPYHDLLADDVVYHAPGRNRLSGDHRGKRAVEEMFDLSERLAGGTFRAELHDVVANDDHVIVMSIARAEREGKEPLKDRRVLVFHMKDGRVTEIWWHPGDQHRIDDFWS